MNTLMSFCSYLESNSECLSEQKVFRRGVVEKTETHFTICTLTFN
jgi:hypothetical protein